MLETPSQITIAVIFLCVFFLSFFVKDWRCRAAATMLIGSLILSYVIPHIFVYYLKITRIPWMFSEMLINLLMIYGFWNLHFRVDGEEREPLWPVALLALEAMIFLSLALFWVAGYGFYDLTVTFFFLVQAVILTWIIIGKMRSQ